tara:strand:+ start:9466 stop:10437 length:972 start_codon:yes stop_codon:yes gene_type:complete
LAEPSAESKPEEVPSGLSMAREAMDSAEFTRVLELTTSAIEDGGLTSAQLQEVYRIEGKALVAVGKSSEARSTFAKLLLINPDASLGEFVSPKITEEVEAARTELGGKALRAQAQALDGGGVSLSVLMDPQSMSTEAEISYSGRGAAVANVRTPLTNGSATFDIPSNASKTIELALLDRYGNALASYSIERKVQATSAGESAAQPGTRGPEQPLWSRWWVWAAGGAACAVVGGSFGIESGHAQDDLDEVLRSPGDYAYRDAKRLEDKARSRARWANVSFAAAGGLVAASAYFYWRSRSHESAPILVPSVDESGASTLQLVGTF